MSFDRPLRGGCQCGRNIYIVQRPDDASEAAQVLFDLDSAHRTSHASPLAAFLRVPLSWYRSTTIAFFPDETSATIRRVYTHPAQQNSQQQFCGFCGTPLSFWSEDPRSESEFIQLSLGSLNKGDLGDLEDLGLVPDSEERPANRASPDPDPAESPSFTGRETRGVPWIDSMFAGSRLGTLREDKGSSQSQDGQIRVEWEVQEWTADDVDTQPSPSKRKREDDGEDDGTDPDALMEGAQH